MSEYIQGGLPLSPSNLGDSSETDAGPSSRKRPVLIVGAGFSKQAGIPVTKGLLEEYERWLEDPKAPGPSRRPPLEVCGLALKVIADLRAWFLRTRRKPDTLDVEKCLVAFARIADMDGDPLMAFVSGMSLCAEDPKLALAAERFLKSFIRYRCVVRPESLVYMKGIADLVRTFHPLDIFSFNFDNAVETFASLHNLKCYDGFSEEWNPGRLEEDKWDIRLHKLHGSINWFITETGSVYKSKVLTTEENVVLDTGEPADPLLVYPEGRFGYVGPLWALLERMRQRLLSCPLAILVGYTMRDEHALRVLAEAGRGNPDLHLMVIDPFPETSLKRVLTPRHPITRDALFSSRLSILPSFFETEVGDLLSERIQPLMRALKRYGEYRGAVPPAGAGQVWSEVIDGAVRTCHPGLLRRAYDTLDQVQCGDFMLLYGQRLAQCLDLAFALANSENGNVIWWDLRNKVVELVRTWITPLLPGSGLRYVVDPAHNLTPQSEGRSLARDNEMLQRALSEVWKVLARHAHGKEVVELLDLAATLLALSEYLGQWHGDRTTLDVDSYVALRNLSQPEAEALRAAAGKPGTIPELIAEHEEAAFRALVQKIRNPQPVEHVYPLPKARSAYEHSIGQLLDRDTLVGEEMLQAIGRVGKIEWAEGWQANLSWYGSTVHFAVEEHLDGGAHLRVTSMLTMRGAAILPGNTFQAYEERAVSEVSGS